VVGTYNDTVVGAQEQTIKEQRLVKTSIPSDRCGGTFAAHVRTKLLVWCTGSSKREKGEMCRLWKCDSAPWRRTLRRVSERRRGCRMS